ncbi:ATP-grasp domain-containing protein [Bacillus sp. A301a_S52]|jgi:biotin carboxylase|nr:ATP-grasp domain-containing protein [Bacillus sp. A301a_S52]
MANKIITIFGNYRQISKAFEEGFEIYNIELKSRIKSPINLDIIQSTKNTVILENVKEIQLYVNYLIETRDIDAIISFTDSNSGVLLAHKLGHQYNINSEKLTSIEGVQILNNKVLFRDYLKQNGFESINYAKVNNRNELVSFYNKIKKPLIVKPICGQGSERIKKINALNDIDNTLEEIYPLLVEEFIDGNEYSVEAISVNGKCKIIGITEKFLINENPNNPFVERGHRFPAKITNEDRAIIENYVSSFIESIPIISGPTHSEVKLTSNGPILIESHLRVGGGAIPRLVEMVTGINIYKETIKLYCGNEYKLKSINYEQEACNLHLTPKQGTVKYVEIPSILNSDSSIKKIDINVEAGMKIEEITNSFDRIYGEIIIQDKKDAFIKAKDVVKTIKIEVE